jgi:hypothetical protein
MTKFNYKKWVTDHKNGKPLFEQVTGPGLLGCPPGSTSGLNLGCQNYGPLVPLTYTGTGNPTFVYNGSPTYATTWTGSCCTGSAGTGSTCYACISGSQQSGPANTSMGSYNTQTGYCNISSSSWQIANAPGNFNPASPPWSTSNIPSYNACTGSAGTGSADWWCTGTGTAGPSCMQSSTQPTGATGGPHPDQTTCQTACTTPSTGSGCDNSPNSQCAQTWFGANASNFTNFMANQACTGTHTYQGAHQYHLQGMHPLWYNRPNQNAQWNPSMQNFSDISQLATAGFGAGSAGQPQKGQFKRKLAKAQWANCMKTTCC